MLTTRASGGLPAAVCGLGSAVDRGASPSSSAGAAFFDGYHQLPWPGGSPRPILHGRCNASLRALWELHPVYKVEAAERR